MPSAFIFIRVKLGTSELVCVALTKIPVVKDVYIV